MMHPVQCHLSTSIRTYICIYVGALLLATFKVGPELPATQFEAHLSC